MLICLECGKVFGYKEVAVRKKACGKFDGVTSYKRVCVCPFCEGDYEEAEKCDECGEWFATFELNENHLCEECREDADEQE